MYSTLARYVLYPVGEAFLRTSVVRYLKILEESQWWPWEQLREWQDEKLRSLVKHAYLNVPYYRRIFDERGISDRDIQTVDDLWKLPPLTKEDIRQNFSDLLATNFKSYKPFLNATSGSTGEPLKYYTTLDVASISWAGEFRSWGWAGYKLGDKRVTLGGSSLVPDKRPSLVSRLRWLGERNLPLSVAHMDEDRMASYAKKISSYRPKFLRGYPSAICRFADYLKKTDVTIRPVAIFTTAEMLLPHHRETIEGQFACEVFDQYGCYDGGPQAMECPTYRGYHVTAEKAVVEFVGDNGKQVPAGSAGEILSTDLHNYAMPFIRYAVGDGATVADRPCSCGRGLPLVESLQGRVTDVIALSNGVTLSGPALTLVFKDCNIKQYQVVQEAKDTLVIRVVKGEGYTEQDTSHFLRVIGAHAGEDVRINVEFVDDIVTTKAGKHRFVISRVPE